MNREGSGPGEGASLTGVWWGVYNYVDNAPPVAFSATLRQDGEWIVGTTEEVGQSGETHGVEISATLQGRRDGANVTWLKLYDRMLHRYDEVVYEGEVNEEATEISGRWRIPGGWSGTFHMLRTPAQRLARAREAAERL